MGVELLAAAPEQIDMKEGNASFLSKMDEKKVTDPGLEHKDPSETVSVDGINGTKGEVKKADHAANSNLPKDAVDEWPASKQTHYFYFVRFRTYEDPQLKAKLEHADKELQRKNQSRFQITDALRAKRAERASLSSEMRPLITENKKYKTAMDEKRKEMEPLHAALGQLRAANTVAREKSVGLCSSVEELNDLIQSLHYRIQHESNTLNEEKQLLKELKQLEATREKVISNTAMKVAMKANNQKDTIQDQVKLIGADMDGVRKDRRAIVAQLNPIYEKLKVVEDEINALEEELRSVSERRDKAYEVFNALRKTRDEANTCFYQNRTLLNMAKDLASKKDTKGLEELCNTEVDKFMSRYSSDRTFRDDYEKRVLPSLDNRQLSRDGRMRNPDEKPIIVVESPPAAKLDAAPLKVIPKQTKEEVVNPPLPVDIVSTKISQGEELIKSSEADKRGKAKASEDNGSAHENDQPVKESSKPKEIDPTKLKEMKREEEMAKAKLAIDRKKKLAEKQAAKLAARSQKDAEKKQKEKEKRAKKKAGTSEPTLPAELMEIDTDAAEVEDPDVKLETSVTEKHHREQKEKVRYRNKKLTKAPNQLPRIILKKKKSHSYGYWAVASAAVAVLLAIVVYYYLAGN